MQAQIGSPREQDQVAFTDPARTAWYYFGEREGCRLGAGICTIPPGSSNQGHAHDEADEVIYVLAGKLRFVFPDGEAVLTAPQAVYIPRGLHHQIFNDGDQPATHTFTFSPAAPAEAIRRKYR